MQHRGGSHCGRAPDHTSGADDGALADARTLAHAGARSHAHARRQVGLNRRGRVHTRHRTRRGIEQLRDAREIKIRIATHDARARISVGRVAAQDHRPGARRGELSRVFRVGKKRNLIWAGGVKRRHLPHAPRTLADQIATQSSDDLLDKEALGAVDHEGATYLTGASASALITLSVMSTRGLAYTASWKMMSYFSDSAIALMARLARSSTDASSSLRRWLRSSR